MREIGHEGCGKAKNCLTGALLLLPSIPAFCILLRFWCASQEPAKGARMLRGAMHFLCRVSLFGV
jgi:hypothetical protein